MHTSAVVSPDNGLVAGRLGVSASQMQRWGRACMASLEDDALSQGELAGVVHGLGLAAHIGLPGIGAGFATAAGVLLAAKCAADLRPAGADVHVGDPTVAAEGREEGLGFAQVGGEDTR